MEQFIPSDGILNQICEDKARFSYIHLIFPRDLPNNNLTRILGSSAKGMITFVGEFYNLGPNPIKRFHAPRFLDVFLEGIKNSFAHGLIEEKTIDYGLFLGDRGLCQGFKGNYFKLQEIKNFWKNKVPINTTKTSYFSGRGLGKEGISNASDSIEVDTKEGILYCIQTHKSLDIVPGKFYFYEGK